MSVEFSEESLFNNSKHGSIEDIVDDTQIDNNNDDDIGLSQNNSPSVSVSDIRSENNNEHSQESLTEINKKSENNSFSQNNENNISQHSIDMDKESIDSNIENNNDNEEGENNNENNSYDAKDEEAINNSISCEPSLDHNKSKSRSQSQIEDNDNNNINERDKVEKTTTENEEINNYENYENEDEDEDAENKIKKEIIAFPDTGTKDVYDNDYELKHQLNYLKKQLKIEDGLLEEILHMKTL